MRLIHEPITVTHHHGIPQHLVWRNTAHTVLDILDSWSSRRQWWTHDEARRYLLVRTNAAVMEIYSTHNRWMLSRIAD
jgi:hypothetical protein